jgi:pentatricopeptide repeat protein
VGKGRNNVELFDKCNRKVCSQPLLLLGWVPNACASIVALEEGRPAHKQTVESGKDSDFFVRSSLVDMYATCGSMEEALRVFDELPS